MKNIVAFLLIICAIFFGNTFCYSKITYNNSSADDVDITVSLLNDKSLFEEASEVYRNNDWEKYGTPFSMELLCTSLFNLGRNTVADILLSTNKKIPNHIVIFAEGYLCMLDGNVSNAKKIFNELIVNDNSQVKYWGIIGILDLFSFTENYNNMSSFIKTIKATTAIDQYTTVIINRYYAVCSYYLGDFEYSEGVIRNLDKEIFSNDLTVVTLQIESHIRGNALKKAIIETDKAIDNFGPLQSLVLLKVNLIRMIGGDVEANTFLDDYLSNAGGALKLNLYRSLSNLDVSDVSDASNQDLYLREIIDIATHLRNDLQSILTISNVLLDYELYSQSGLLMNIFLLKARSMHDFFLYNFYKAKFGFMTDDKEMINRNLRAANNMSPNDIGLLWLKYQIAIYNSDDNSALKILNRIILWDPYDVETLLEKIELLYAMELWPELIECYNRLIATKRFVASENLKKATAYYHNALRSGDTLLNSANSTGFLLSSAPAAN